MLKRRLRSSRRAATSVIFATAVIPIVGLGGLAVDYGMWSELDASLTNAINAAALNAAKVAATGEINNDPNYITEGKAAATQWWLATVLSSKPSVNGGGLTINISGTSAITASVTYSGGHVTSFFGNLFGKSYYPITVSASATIQTAPFLNVYILLDNSSSMQIAATAGDIEDMLELSPCDPSWADYYTGTPSDTVPNYSGYMCSYGSYSYTQMACGSTGIAAVTPIWPAAQKYLPPVNASTLTVGGGPSCKGVSDTQTKKINGVVTTPTAGAPCAFACHSDGSTFAGQGNDLYARARSTNGYTTLCSDPAAVMGSCKVTLRFDQVKSAVNLVITNMQTDNTAANNLQVGVWDFNTQLNADYAPNGDAGGSFTTALAAVGAPPKTKNGRDTGIQPDAFVTASSHSDTDFYHAATSLAGSLTAAGDGSSAASPEKVLFLVTDGMSNVGDLNITAFDSSRCNLFKTMGYTVYVVYTPYLQQPHQSYFYYAAPYAEPQNNSQVSRALQACASSASDYIVASDQTTLNAALTGFLKTALKTPARFTL